MPSLHDLTARCHRIGTELCERDLSLHELVDRATALTFLARSLEELVEKQPTTTVVPGHVGSGCQRIDVALAELHEAAAIVQAGNQEELGKWLLDAQRHLRAACRLMAA
jgi:hypothetical protein